jgi:hypothetical protein
MELPFHLTQLPPEAHAVLRQMHIQHPATVEDLENAGISPRSVGKAIRRLVNRGYIEFKSPKYGLTKKGKLAAKELVDYYAAKAGQVVEATPQKLMVQRKVVVVGPRSYLAEQPVDLYIGVNPPDHDSHKLPYGAQLELRVTAVGATLPVGNIAIDVPPEKAAVPTRLRLLPAAETPAVRVRIDAFQSFEFNHFEPLGGFYFDVPVSKDQSKQDKSPRAVSMDVTIVSPE